MRARSAVLQSQPRRDVILLFIVFVYFCDVPSVESESLAVGIGRNMTECISVSLMSSRSLLLRRLGRELQVLAKQLLSGVSSSVHPKLGQAIAIRRGHES